MSEENQTTVLGEDIVEEQTASDNQNVADQANNSNDYLANFVGEDKKYKSVEEAAAALAKKAVHADEHIKRIEQENEELRQATLKSKTVDDILKAINSEDEEAVSQAQASSQPQEVPKGLTPEDLDSWYEQRRKKELEEVQTKKELERIQSNQDKSWELLGKEFDGAENAKAAVRRYINNDPSKAEIINNLGSKDPKSLVKFMRSVKSEPTQYSSDSGTVNITPEMITKGLTWSKVKQMEKENPKLKKDRKWSVKVSQAAAADSNFFDK